MYGQEEMSEQLDFSSYFFVMERVADKVFHRSEHVYIIVLICLIVAAEVEKTL